MEKDESHIKLSDEFKKDLRKKAEVNWPVILGLIVLIIVVFSSLIIGTYQIFYKPDKVQDTGVSSEEKIESRPAEEKPTTTTPKTTPAPVVKPAPVAPTVETYTVVEGDTLSGIAAQFNTTSKVLSDYNGLSDPEVVLHIGQKIKIPK